jgi:hypothetical protein
VVGQFGTSSVPVRDQRRTSEGPKGYWWGTRGEVPSGHLQGALKGGSQPIHHFSLDRERGRGVPSVGSRYSRSLIRPL